MGGMLEAAAPAMRNPLLAKTEQAIEAKVPADLEQYVSRIVTAGITAAFSPQSHGQIFQGLDQSVDKVHDIAMGTVGLMLILSKQSKDTMPKAPMLYAGLILMLHGLDYLEQTMQIPIGNDEIAKATQIFMPVMQEKLGLTHDKLKAMSDTAHKHLQNPTFMQKYKQSQMSGAK